MPASHARSMTATPVSSSTASNSPAKGAVPSPNRVTVRAVRPSGTRWLGFNFGCRRLELEDQRHLVVAFAAEVMGDFRHRRHGVFPALIERTARQRGDCAWVVVALDVVEQVEAVAEDHVLLDAHAAHAFQHLGPHRPVIFLITFLGAWLEPGVKADFHALNKQGWGCREIELDWSRQAWSGSGEGRDPAGVWIFSSAHLGGRLRRLG